MGWTAGATLIVVVLLFTSLIGAISDKGPWVVRAEHWGTRTLRACGVLAAIICLAFMPILLALCVAIIVLVGIVLMYKIL